MNEQNKLSLLLLLLILASNTSLIFPHNFPLIKLLFGSIFTLCLPGLLIVLNIKFRRLTVWELTVYTVGLSVVFLIFTSLILNESLSTLGIESPLQLKYLLPSFNVLYLMLLARYRHIANKVELTRESNALTPKLLAASSVILPILAVIGASTLNVNGSNIFIVLLLVFISLITLLLSIFADSRGKSPYLFILLNMSLSLLLMYSLRSNYLVGWDIQSEFRVFNVTLGKQLWATENISHAYNTTLGVTLLPTVLNIFTGIPALYVFKLLYPIIFSLSVPTIYLMFSSFLSPMTAFLSCFFFIIQFQFFQQMPALARQQIALLMFFLSIFTLFNPNIGHKSKQVLFLMFNFTLIVSHYSTAYISVTLYAFIYMLTLILRYLNKIYYFFKTPRTVITFPIVLILMISIFGWYGTYTGSISYLSGFFQRLTANLSNVFSQEEKSEQAKLAVIGTSKIYSSIEINTYENQIVQEYETDRSWVNRYSLGEYEKYPTYPMYAESIPRRFPKLEKLVVLVIQADQKIIKSLMIVTLIFASFFLIKKKQSVIPTHFILFSWACLLLILTAIFIPYISIAYNLERLYQQSLTFLSIYSVLGFLVISIKLKLTPKLGYLLTTIFFLRYFHVYSGFTSSIIGGSASLNLFNFGEEYERFFIRDQEKASADWLAHNVSQSVISTDSYGWLRLQSNTMFSNGFIIDLYPGVIDRNGYVYATHANFVKNNVRVNYRNTFIMYNFPLQFLNDNKNLIYSNKSSAIYK